MKKLYLLFVFTFITFFANAQDPDAFITTWQVQSNDLSIYVPIYNPVLGEDSYTINFGDGTVLSNQEGMASHVYAQAGIYTVAITGNFNRFAISGGTPKLRSIEQWGSTQWSTMAAAYANCPNLVVNALDAPDLSLATDMSDMFGNCSALNQSLNNWDVSHITNMDGMFAGCSLFNQPLNNWDVSNVTNMSFMFGGASSFNQPLESWDVSNVIDFGPMFNNATSFNQPLDGWDISSAVQLSQMFNGATSFNQPIESWDVSSVGDMNAMFYNATSFNQPLENWDMTSVTYMPSMFYGATSFNQPLNGWDISNTQSLQGMFNGATSFNQPLDNWDVSNVLYMSGIFYNALSFDQDISAWNFNPEVFLNGNFVSDAFLSNTSMSTGNYDALLLKFAQLGLQNKNFVAEGIKYCDSEVHNYLDTQLGWTFSGDSIGPNCSLNTVSGNVRFDENANGCDSADLKINNLMITATDETDSYSTFPSLAGTYTLGMPEGSYTITLQNVPSYFTATPATQSVAFTGLGTTEPLDFCLTANQAVNDLNITLLPLNQARPGFDASYRLVVQNIGTQTVSNVTATLGYEIIKQTFVSASQTPASITADPPSLTFDIASIQPFETKTIDIVLHTAAPPVVNGNDVLYVGGTVTNTNDFTPADNAFSLPQTVVNAFDPNDKTVLQGEEITIDQLDEYLDYVVRFQNTGTASAITVRIDDVLNANLDWTTLRPVNASHNYRVEITEGNDVSFIFNNINLPAEADNEAGSHGFIAFKIKPLQTLQEGDVITGSAAIYFDYNAPIITNTVTTTIYNATAGTGQDGLNKGISVYPNPVNDILYLNPAAGIVPTAVIIYNIQGRELLNFTSNLTALNISSLSEGMYLLSVKTNAGQLNYRIVKK